VGSRRTVVDDAEAKNHPLTFDAPLAVMGKKRKTCVNKDHARRPANLLKRRQIDYPNLIHSKVDVPADKGHEGRMFTSAISHSDQQQELHRATVRKVEAKLEERGSTSESTASRLYDINYEILQKEQQHVLHAVDSTKDHHSCDQYGHHDIHVTTQNVDPIICRLRNSCTPVWLNEMVELTKFLSGHLAALKRADHKIGAMNDFVNSEYFSIGQCRDYRTNEVRFHGGAKIFEAGGPEFEEKYKRLMKLLQQVQQAVVNKTLFTQELHAAAVKSKGLGLVPTNIHAACSTALIAKNPVAGSHFDKKDQCPSIAIKYDETDCDCTEKLRVEQYMVLENVTTVPWLHGDTIVWHGKRHRHCCSYPVEVRAEGCTHSICTWAFVSYFNQNLRQVAETRAQSS
jgi:hypothetical protein